MKSRHELPSIAMVGKMSLNPIISRSIIDALEPRWRTSVSATTRLCTCPLVRLGAITQGKSPVR